MFLCLDFAYIVLVVCFVCVLSVTLGLFFSLVVYVCLFSFVYMFGHFVVKTRFRFSEFLIELFLQLLRQCS